MRGVEYQGYSRESGHCFLVTRPLDLHEACTQTPSTASCLALKPNTRAPMPQYISHSPIPERWEGTCHIKTRLCRSIFGCQRKNTKIPMKNKIKILWTPENYRCMQCAINIIFEVEVKHNFFIAVYSSNTVYVLKIYVFLHSVQYNYTNKLDEK